MNKTAIIYARKSRATEKGESIEHQIEKATSYCALQGWDYLIFTDYDYSGGSTKRPEFDRMIKTIKGNKDEYCALICYKLARVCRNMVDFVKLFDFLFENGLDFISISEKFDTHTIFGRAQMYLAAIFAEMERENIREQVSDNMYYRAAKGKWNGGPVPIGYNAIKVEAPNIKGIKIESKLIINEEESNIVNFIYDEYLKDGGSIRGITKKLLLTGYKTKNGGVWRENQVTRILKNALYCKADKDAFVYFNTDNPISICEEDDNIEFFDGNYGLFYYGRRKYKNETTTAPQDKEKWILSIGEHQGFIPGKVFVQAQNKLKLNKTDTPRLGTSTKSPLTGLVRCKKCDTAMVIHVGKKAKSDDDYSYLYFDCRKKTESSGLLCTGTRINARHLEARIIEYLKEFFSDEFKLNEIVNKYNAQQDKNKIEKNDVEKKKLKIETELKKIQKSISNLVDAIALGTIPPAIAKNKYDELDKTKKAFEEELENLSFTLLNSEISVNTEYMLSVLSEIKPEDLEEADFEKRKYFYRGIIENIYLDDKNIEIKMFLSNSNNLLFCPRKDMDSLQLST